MASSALLLVVLFVSACASAGSARDQPADAPAPHDAPSHPIDASPPRDASLDAFVPRDAPGPDAGNPLICTSNTDCVVPGTCCFFAVCVPGTTGGTLCFPS
jgi:hypothetical protein